MLTTTPVDDFARLSAAGWTIFANPVIGPEGHTWLVTGRRGSHTLRSMGSSRGDALARAVHVAGELGLVESEPCT